MFYHVSIGSTSEVEKIQVTIVDRESADQPASTIHTFKLSLEFHQFSSKMQQFLEKRRVQHKHFSET
jgi:hypothetical protein